MKEVLKEQIKKALSKVKMETDKEIMIEKPKDQDHGDYSCNIAMQLAKPLGLNPRNLAQTLMEQIQHPAIEKVEMAGPGFINFYLTKDYLYGQINVILKEKEDFGRISIGNGQKINLEFVSANPTGTLHLGHARGASYGDALARILSFAGYQVTREYYVNDGGNQIDHLEESIFARYQELRGEEVIMPEDGYHGKEIITLAKELYEEYGGIVLEKKVIRQKGLSYLLDEIKKDLAHFRVSFDVWTSEKTLYEKGEVENTLKTLTENGHTYLSEGAVFLKTTDYGDEKDRVLVKKDHTNTYLLPDIAYHMDKYNRGFDELIDVLGADHHGYIARLKASIAMMGKNPSLLDVRILQMVRLLRDGEEVKMSKRTGTSVTMNELVEEVGLDASRYFFAMRSLDTQLDFDLALATKKTNENPVYYVQYAYARICSILSTVTEDFKEPITYHTITSPYADHLLRQLCEFPSVIESSANKKAPHFITNYVYDLATLFHTFYAHEKVLTEEENATRERLYLIKAVAQVIKNALTLIGVDALEKM